MRAKGKNRLPEERPRPRSGQDYRATLRRFFKVWFLAVVVMHPGVPTVSAQTAPAVQTTPQLDVDPVVTARGGAIYVTPENSTVSARDGRVRVRVSVPATNAPVLSAKKTDPGHQLLRRLVASGQAAGNIGDLYENRDRNHSPILAEAHPQLTHVLYSREFQERGGDYGLSHDMLFDAPLIGNSSTAMTTTRYWRSLPRLALTTPGIPERLYQNYREGQIHVYPEHNDHDPKEGDLLPANTPYMLISQGSSRSDQAHIEALIMILAAFRPDTKAFLREHGLIASTVQMVYRRARVGVRSRAAYLSGGAHPTVFRDSDIALARMVGLANAIKPGDVPPMVRIEVLAESKAVQGVDYFGEGLSEEFFDTPSAVSRIWRSRKGRRSMIVTAADTKDPNDRELTFDWVVLRGDPQRVRITPVSDDGRYALIDIDWQDALPTPGAPDILSHRIDIGVFANNGVHDSTPAFISVLLPRHETRTYANSKDGIPIPQSIDRSAPKGTYADPSLFPITNWRDDYVYDVDGKLVGWTRYRGDERTEFDPTGARRDIGAVPRYPLQKLEDGRRVVLEETDGSPAKE